MSSQEAVKSDRELRRALSSWDVTFLEIGAMIGAGWLFGSLYAASIAGPAAIISWVLAGGLVLLIALTYNEVGSMFLKSGGLVRYPQYSHGGLTSFFTAWTGMLQDVAVSPSEAEAAITYMGAFLPFLVTAKGELTAVGYALAAAFMIAFFALNWFGVHVLGRSSTAIGWWKVIVPMLTAVLLLALFVHPSNFSTPSFAPYGVSAILAAIPLSGIAYAFYGFRQSIDFAGEVKDYKNLVGGAERGLLLVIALYALLQASFIGAVVWSRVQVNSGSWSALQYSVLVKGPFFKIMELSGLPVLLGFAFVLMIDAVVSPLGTGWVYMGVLSRTFYGMAANGQLPRSFLRLNKYRVPSIATLVALLLGFIFLYKFPAWVDIMRFITDVGYLAFLPSGAVLLALRRVAPDAPRPYLLRGAWAIAIAASAATFLIVYWSTFPVYWGVFIAVLAGLPVYLAYGMPNRYGGERRKFVTLAAIYAVFLAALSYLILYRYVMAPYYAASAKDLSLPVSMAYVGPFVLYTVLMAVATVAVLEVAGRLSGGEGLRQVRAGYWLVASLFILLVLTFLGEYSVFARPVIPFPLDTVISAAVGALIGLWGALSGYRTSDLEAELRLANSAATQ